MTSFLPDGYESLKVEKKYWKTSEMGQGDHRLRIMLQPIGGWIDWNNSKPMRFRPNQKPTQSFSEKGVLPFWSCYVWDYARNGLYILEIKQKGIIVTLTNLGKDPDWGDFTKYDIKINKKGNGMETRYMVTAMPHKPITEEMADALRDSPVRLDALYEGKDPWTDLIGETVQYSAHAKTEPVLIGTPFETLAEYMAIEDLPTVTLTPYLNLLSQQCGQPVDKIIESALSSDKMIARFTDSYGKHLRMQSMNEATA